jgi:hypothetical protein
VLSQTFPSPPPAGDKWTPANVLLVLAFVAGTLIPSIIALMKSWKAEATADNAQIRAEKAQTTAAEAKGKADAHDGSIDRLAQTNRTQADQILGIAREMPPTSGSYSQAVIPTPTRKEQ